MVDEAVSVLASKVKAKLDELRAKPTVSMERETRATEVKESAIASELKQIEIEVEETEHAFALVKEIREKIEAAYQNLTANDE